MMQTLPGAGIKAWADVGRSQFGDETNASTNLEELPEHLPPVREQGKAPAGLRNSLSMALRRKVVPKNIELDSVSRTDSPSSTSGFNTVRVRALHERGSFNLKAVAEAGQALDTISPLSKGNKNRQSQPTNLILDTTFNPPDNTDRPGTAQSSIKKAKTSGPVSPRQAFVTVDEKKTPKT